MSSIRIQLLKRTRFTIGKGNKVSQHEASIGNVDVLNVNESHEGVSTLTGELRSTLNSTIATWSVTDIAELQVRSTPQSESKFLVL